jgi:hypothetical protein
MKLLFAALFLFDVSQVAFCRPTEVGAAIYVVLAIVSLLGFIGADAHDNKKD